MNVIVASAQNSPRGSEDFDSQAALFGHGFYGAAHAVPVPVVAYDPGLWEQVQRRYQICRDTVVRMIGIQIHQIGAQTGSGHGSQAIHGTGSDWNDAAAIFPGL